MKRLSMVQVLALHEQIAAQSGGGSGVRDGALLESVLELSFQMFGDEALFPTLADKAARLDYGLICNHLMLDGNKRLDAHAVLAFLALNGVRLHYIQQELSRMVARRHSRRYAFRPIGGKRVLTAAKDMLYYESVVNMGRPC